MTGPLAARLSSGRPVLLDGAMGTELDRRGVRTYLPLWSALGLIERPDVVQEIHRDYAAAGAEILTTNTFRTTRRTLARADVDPNEVGELNELAVRLARKGATDAGRDVLVAGSIAPLEDCYSPERSPDPKTAHAEHREQAMLLAEAGADFLMIETMPLVAEAEAAVRAALGTGLEVTVGFVIGEDGRLLSGETLDDAVEALGRFPVAAFFVNCSAPPVISNGLKTLGTLTSCPVGGYANLGVVEETVGWSADQSFTGERYADSARSWLDAGAAIVGGCCGTRPEHIAALRSVLDASQA
jgi:S-methylmethionine-dependent homocysteine/selenocysteine methylase